MTQENVQSRDYTADDAEERRLQKMLHTKDSPGLRARLREYAEGVGSCPLLLLAIEFATRVSEYGTLGARTHYWAFAFGRPVEKRLWVYQPQLGWEYEPDIEELAWLAIDRISAVGGWPDHGSSCDGANSSRLIK